MDLEGKQVSNAKLGQLRQPSEAEIQRSVSEAARSPAEQKAHEQRMAQLEKAAAQFVAMKQQAQPAPSAHRQQATDRVEPPQRNNSVAQTGYSDRAGKAAVPEHVAIQRSVQGHVERNLQRELRAERFREIRQQVKEDSVAVARQVGRAVKDLAKTVQSELAGKDRTQSMTLHRDKVQSIEPGKEQQQQKGKERQRGRER